MAEKEINMASAQVRFRSYQSGYLLFLKKSGFLVQVQDPYIWDVQNDTLSSSSVSSLGAEYSGVDGDENAVLIPFSRAETAFAAVCAILFTIVGIAGKTHKLKLILQL